VGSGTEKMIDSMTLYALSGGYVADADQKSSELTFCQYSVVGCAPIESPEERTLILRAVEQGIAESDGMTMRCFVPHHGLHFVEKERTTDVLICFECLWVWRFYKGRKESLPTTRAAKELLDAHLDYHGIPRKERPW
jgi:hypothetical protein